MSSHPILNELSPEERDDLNGVKFLDLKEWSQAASGVIFFAEDLSANQVIAEVYTKKIHHLLQKNEKRLPVEMKIAKAAIDQRTDYFNPEFCFFNPTEKRLVTFAGASEKQMLRDKYIEFVDQSNSPSLSQCAYAIFEELYMNAVIDAPKEAAKRNVPGDNKNPEFFLARNGDSMQISCSDYFGSLDTNKLLARMHEVYEKGAGEVINMRNTAGGAGIGCVILFENCSSLIIGVNPGHQTKVTCILPIGVSNRQREKMKKSLHWFHI